MQVEYVRVKSGVYLVADSRVSLDSLVYLFREGMSAESMVDCYPALTLERVHGALAYYLRNQREVDAYLEEGRRIAESQHDQSRETNAELIAKLQRARYAVPHSRLMSISTAGSSEACDAQRQKSIYELRRTPNSMG